MALAPGTLLGQYEILAPLGAGGMGEVYRARDSKLGREVAIKILPEAFATDADRVARFQREARTLASLNHPNIAILYGLEGREGQDRREGEPGLFLVMEIVEGQDLAQRIERGPIPLDETLAIATQIAEALEAAHDQGIVHRDLKPANIKVREDGRVKVLDFGLAKAVEGAGQAGGAGKDGLSQSPTITSPAMTQAGMILGTAAYMSPEQAKGRPADKRSDVWSFGCVLYEMLTGQRPFDGDDTTDVLGAVVRLEPDWSRLPASVPLPIVALIKGCLVKDRRQRVGDIAAALFAIRTALGYAGSPSAMAPTASLPRRNRLALAAALLVGGIVGGLAVGAIRFFGTPPVPAPHPSRRFGIDLPALMQMHATASAVRNIAISPDGFRLALVSDARELYVWPADQLNPVHLPGLVDSQNPFFSPDGQWIGLFQTGSNELRKVSVTGGPAISLAGGTNGSPPRGAVWLADGSIIFATTDGRTGLQRASSDGSVAPEVLTTPDAGHGELDHLFPSVLPGGTTLLFTIQKSQPAGSSDVAVFDLATRKYRVVLHDAADAQFVPTGHLVFSSRGAVRTIAFDLAALEVRGESRALSEDVGVSASGAVAASFAADGTLAYLPGGYETSQRTLVWVDRQGREEDLGAEPHSYAVPRASPDGTRIAAHLDEPNSHDIVVFDLARKTLLRLTFDGKSHMRPAWTPDSRWVLFRSDSVIERKAADGSGSSERVAPINGDGGPHGVTPDGRTLVLGQIDSVTARDLWVLDLEGDHVPRPLVVEPRGQSNSAISPDGRWVAYHQEETGSVIVRPFPKVDAGRWDVATSHAKWPLWGRDGRELFYVTERGIVSVAIDTSQGTFRWTSPQIVEPKLYVSFEGQAGPRNYDVSADGKRFLVVKDDTRERSRSFVIVQNWFDELRTADPSAVTRAQ